MSLLQNSVKTPREYQAYKTLMFSVQWGLSGDELLCNTVRKQAVQTLYFVFL